MSEETVLATLGRARIIPVVALDDASVVADLCAALQAGGIFTVEITFRTAEAAAALERAAEVEGMVGRRGDGVDGRAGARRGGSRGGVRRRSGNGRRSRRGLRRARTAVLPGHRHPLRARARPPARPNDGQGLPSLDRGRRRVPSGRLGDVPTGEVPADRRDRRRVVASYLAVPAVVACGGSWISDAQSIRERDFAGIERRARAAIEAIG